MHILFALLVSLFLERLFVITESKNDTIIKVPYRKDSTWIWSWSSPWTKALDNGGKPVYYPCDVSPSTEPNTWIRSTDFLVGDAKRIDVTVEYAVSDCSKVSYAFCKQNLKLFIYRSSIKYTGTNIVPDPAKEPPFYQIFGTTSPKNLTTGSLSRSKTNTEIYSFSTNSTTPYYYLAIQYQGGCFALYSVTISYSFCRSLAIHSSLIQLPRTIAPVNGSIQVSGPCAANAQPRLNNITLYGDCQANGEWSSNVMSGGCLCKAGYGKSSNGSGAICKECASGKFQDKQSSNACKSCPMNSVQDVDRRKCNCAPTFYRTKNESIFHNCTGQPSSPQGIKSIFLNATSAVIEWSTPLDLGGRPDEYYEVECKKCDEKGKNCTMDCTGARFTHAPKTSRKSTVRHLSPYTFYQFKVFAKNGVTDLAEKNGEKSKSAFILKRTSESKPGTLVLTVKILNATTVFLSWTVLEPNGVITYYQVIYYPVDDGPSRRILNTTKSNITINGLIDGRKYIFEVRASTSAGLGQPGNITKTVGLPSTGTGTRHPSSSSFFLMGVAVAVPTMVMLLFISIIIAVCRRWRKRGRHVGKQNLIPMNSERLFIDPSNYNSPLEAMRRHTTEIDRNNLLLKINIGEGEFADVYKGIFITESNREVVAVKILKPTSSTKNKKDFIREAAIMGQFKHPNVIELKGVITLSPDTPMMIVTEFMINGSLDHFLKSRDGMLTSLQLVGIARGVANGMAYLTEMSFIHRDLAARNILVAENMASKISDFGLSRELDNSENNPESIYLTQGGKIPVRWTAPESIAYKKYSSASDVWSFGILLWEIMAFAERPYWDWENEKVATRVQEGFRLPPPMNCPKSIHDVMLDCWDKDMNNRPKFTDIVKRLDEMIRSPDKMNHQEIRFTSPGAQVNLGEVTSVEEWLIEINMSQYTDRFLNAGFTELDQVISLNKEGLERLGVTLIGHRNKLNKSIRELRKHHPQQPDFEIEI